MNLSTLESISEILNDNQNNWIAQKENIEKIYETVDQEILINQFENFIETSNSSKKPHLSLVFYISLLIIQNNKIEEIAEYAKNKKSFSFLLKGMEIYLKSEDINLRYEVDLDFGRFHNKYKAYSFFSGNAPEIGRYLQPTIFAMNMIHFASPDKFYELLDYDEQYGIFVYYMTAPVFKLDYSKLLFLLKSSNEIKANGAFYTMCSKLNYLIRQKRFSDEPVDKEIETELISIQKVLNDLPNNKKADLLCNYIFAENIAPNFFVELLNNVNKNFIIDSCQKQNFANLNILVKLSILIKDLNYKELQSLFIDKLLEWIDSNGNQYSWDQTKKSVYKIIENIDTDLIAELKEKLVDLRKNLFVSNFDKQVRYSMFLRDENKDKAIQDIFDCL